MQRRERRGPAPRRERGGVGVQDKEVSTVRHERGGAGVTAGVILLRGQRGASIAGEDELALCRGRRDTREWTAPRHRQRDINVRVKGRLALGHGQRGSDAEEKVMSVPRRGQRGADVADEEYSELQFRRRNTRVADGEVAAPRRRQRGFGATDKERLQCRGGDFSFVDAASRKLSLRKEKPCRGPAARHGRGEICVATGSAVPALLVPRRQRSAGVTENVASEPQRGRGCSGTCLHLIVKRAGLRASVSLLTDTLICAPLSSFGNPVQVI